MLGKIIIFLFVTATLLVLGGGLWGFLTLQTALHQSLQLQEQRTLDVPPGSTPAGVFASLERDQVLENSAWLRRYWQWRMKGAVLHVGEYELQPEMTAAELLHMLERGDVLQRHVTLVEGWNFAQVRAALRGAERLQQTLPEDWSDEQVMDALDLAGVHPEGRFFPDTYQYTLGMSDRDLLIRAYQRMEQQLAEAWEDRAKDLPFDTAYEALIMASIVERETGVPSERPEIAGVFTRRLKIGMRLQTDPTVIYGMGEDYAGRITRRHLTQPTAYNTYVIDGLPPTPIAMPGRGALRAAVNPKPGKSLYFVAKGDGSHVFSNSLAEHNRAVRQYQLQRRSDYRSSPAPAPVEESAE
ncbi:MAG: endolytic transglycosylase MltG [Halopseudomonas sp.]|uniref:endolytic transglycosylase MltG n=1 Tax=Halopseudomonas sp. TaxID=2901191 RepID=UPI003002C059